jgi:hypothetical protein
VGQEITQAEAGLEEWINHLMINLMGYLLSIKDY